VRSASQAARTMLPARPSRANQNSMSRHRATERQRPAPPNKPQPRTKFSGQRDRPGEKANLSHSYLPPVVTVVSHCA